MLCLVVNVRVRPDRREEFLSVIATNAQSSLRDEPGCLRFEVFPVEGDSDAFVFVEVYTDQAAVEAHRGMPHFAVWRAAAADLLEPGSQVNKVGELMDTASRANIGPSASD
jgi:quinol monooxygenase YgiN